MRVIGLLSGGKDSCYALMQCVAAGHEIAALATLTPPQGVDESNSYMYQSVGVAGVATIAAAMGGVPHYSRTVCGSSLNTSASYDMPLPADEVEDLYHLLKQIVDSVPDVGGISVGAVLSNYQRVRVEHVCGRLGLVCYAYLWQRNQRRLLAEMISCGVEAILVKVAGAGLVPSKHCGKTLLQMQATLQVLNERYGVHECGEGGEYETFTLDCPLYRRSITVGRRRLVEEAGDIGLLLLDDLTLQDKQENGVECSFVEAVRAAGVPTPEDFVADITSDAAEQEFTSGGNGDRGGGVDDFCGGDSAGSALADQTETLKWHYGKYGLDEEYLIPKVRRRGVRACRGGGWWSAWGWSGDDLEELLEELNEVLKAQLGASLGADSCEVRLFVRRLSAYASFNASYQRLFPHHPPVRACLQTCLPTAWQLEIIGYTPTAPPRLPRPPATPPLALLPPLQPAVSGTITEAAPAVSETLTEAGLAASGTLMRGAPATSELLTEAAPAASEALTEAVLTALVTSDVPSPPYHAQQDRQDARQVLHVQSVSHWAPANIGPYSQAVKVGGAVLLAGMLGLVPGSMQLVEGGAGRQTQLALRHVGRVMEAATGVAPERGVALVVQALCYASSSHALTAGREVTAGAGSRIRAGAAVLWLQVERLPRDADVEVHVWGHVQAPRAGVDHRLVSTAGGLVVRQQLKRMAGGAASIITTLDACAESDGFTVENIMEVFVNIVRQMCIEDGNSRPWKPKYHRYPVNAVPTNTDLTTEPPVDDEVEVVVCSETGIINLTVFYCDQLVPMNVIHSVVNVVRDTYDHVTVSTVPVQAVEDGSYCIAIVASRYGNYIGEFGN